MKCPKCGAAKGGVVNSVSYETVVWRRHKCKECGHSWHTSEMEDEPLMSIDAMKRRK